MSFDILRFNSNTIVTHARQITSSLQISGEVWRRWVKDAVVAVAGGPGTVYRTLNLALFLCSVRSCQYLVLSNLSMMFQACVGMCVIFQLEWTLLLFGCCLLSDGNVQGTLRGTSNKSSLLLLTLLQGPVCSSPKAIFDAPFLLVPCQCLTPSNTAVTLALACSSQYSVVK